MITVTVCCVNVISLHSTTSNWAGQPLNGDWQHFSADQGEVNRYLMQVDQDQVRSFLGLTGGGLTETSLKSLSLRDLLRVLHR